MERVSVCDTVFRSCSVPIQKKKKKNSQGLLDTRNMMAWHALRLTCVAALDRVEGVDGVQSLQVAAKP